jgi:hypothetical protein
MKIMSKAERIRNTKGTLADKAVLSVLADWPLEPGQMLLFGPKTVKILSTRGAFNGSLPDMLLLERSEWNHVQKG